MNTTWCRNAEVVGINLATMSLSTCTAIRRHMRKSDVRRTQLSRMLEPCAGKLARTVLRGRGVSNGSPLPDH
jgi:hypothetical protein